jgi:hypothetical protein
MRYALLFLFLLGLNPVAGAERAEVERWRKEYEGKLFSDPRLMAVGRFELREGKQSVGSGPTNSLVLPAGPAALATVELHGKTAQIALQPGVTGTYNNQATTKAVVPVAQASSPDQSVLGRICRPFDSRAKRANPTHALRQAVRVYPCTQATTLVSGAG